MKNNIFFLFLLITIKVEASDSLLCKKNIVTTFFTVDVRENIYYINTFNEIIKSPCNDSSFISYSNRNLGKPTYIDVSNPLKILVFYPDQQTVVILDNQLAELSQLSLKGNVNKPNYQPAAICKHTGTDHIWIYDELSRKLIRLDESGNVLASSEAFDQLFNFSVEVTGLFSANDKVYLATKTNGILMFDAYGSYVHDFEMAMQVNQITDNYMVGINNNVLQFFDMRSLELLNYPLAGAAAYLIGKNIFLYTDSAIKVYKFIGTK